MREALIKTNIECEKSLAPRLGLELTFKVLLNCPVNGFQFHVGDWNGNAITYSHIIHAGSGPTFARASCALHLFSAIREARQPR